MIEQQVWLAQGQAVKVLARSDALLTEAEKAHYGLVALLVRTRRARLAELFRTKN